MCNCLGIKYDRVLLLLSDAAAYMLKARIALCGTYPKMRHLTCLAHALHRICEEIRAYARRVDALIATGNRQFRKCPSRVMAFKRNLPNVSLPPKPVLTRWGTWLEAAIYYADHFLKLRNLVKTFDAQDSVIVIDAQSAFGDDQVLSQLAYIKAHFGNKYFAFLHYGYLKSVLCL